MISHENKHYTLTLDYMIREYNFNIKDYNLPYFTNDKNMYEQFLEKFINKYRFYEISFNTPSQFIHELKTKLMIKMPYYEQLYMTELRIKNIDFMVNKEYRETLEKTLTIESTQTNENNINSNSTLVSSENQEDSQASSDTTNNTNETNSLNKTSNMNNGIANVSLNDGYLTSIGYQDENSTGTTTSNGTITGNKSITKNDEVNQSETNSGSLSNKGKQTETITTDGKGNIGVTSSAELLKGWREILINLDEIIINDCRDLFLYIY